MAIAIGNRSSPEFAPETIAEGRRKKEEGRRKKEEGRRKKEEGRRKKVEGRRKKEEGRRKREEDFCAPFPLDIKCGSIRIIPLCILSLCVLCALCG
ncbi:hypothetical protein [Microcoleus sp. D2_18a_B4]|uniref:hypothetical protein n=1 Tax=Microcoleus sp. D2_18a_B4 TaxID=3055329 RepID=UPI002FD22E50